MKTNYLHKKQIALPKKQKLTTDNKIQNTHQVPSSPLVLSDLPDDILTIIFTSLYHSNPLNYINLGRVCRKFNTLLTTKPISSGLDFSKFNPPLRRGGDILLQQLLNLIKPTSILNVHRIETHNTHNKILEVLALSCPGLTHLDLSSCEKIADPGLRALAHHCPNLTYLNLARCFYITDEGLADITKNCPNLTYLNLEDCCGIKDAGLQAIAENCPNLTNLNFVGTDIIIVELAKPFPKLTSLHVGGDNITDEGLAAITKNCPNLTSLHVAGDNITDEGLAAITKNCPNLTYLNLQQTGITDGGVHRLQTALPNCNINA